MKGFKIKAYKISVSTVNGDYGFACEFSNNLNVIRGNNSSGKSTFINGLVYSLGMEEIIGGQGVKVLPYALKEYVEDNKTKIPIVTSFTFIELENSSGKRITIKRPIKSELKNPKLMEVIQGPYLTSVENSFDVIPTYLHDKGSAQSRESGFFRYLEDFIGVELPKVATANGGEAKLFLQEIFSAMLIEQKRGWTDYLANIPYFAIKDAKIKVVEFLLNLDVFENERKRNSILAEISDLNRQWSEAKYQLKLISETESLIVHGVSDAIDDSFDKNLVSVKKPKDGVDINMFDFVSELNKKLEEISHKSDQADDVPSQLTNKYKEEKASLEKLIVSLDATTADVGIAKSRKRGYEDTLAGISEELDKNKIALKLKRFGSEQNIEVARESCPSCHQVIDDSLLLPDTFAQPMSIDENIKYLENQKKMVVRYIPGLDKQIERLQIQCKSLDEQISEKRALCLSISRDIRGFDSITEAEVRLKLQTEDQIAKISKANQKIDEVKLSLEGISLAYVEAAKKLKGLPAKNLSFSDRSKVDLLEATFKYLASSFGYNSAATSDIEINKDTLYPYLSGIELRQVEPDSKKEGNHKVKTDIKSDSSASDFVRLIWAYLLSIQVVSSQKQGNHFGCIVFDEPGQHSMRTSSVNELLKVMSAQMSLQSIVAASFDENDSVFQESVVDVSHKLIHIEGKLLKPIK